MGRPNTVSQKVGLVCPSVFLFKCLFVWVLAWISAPHACLVPTEARRGWHGILELELKTVVSCYVGTGNPTQVPRNSGQRSNHWAVSAAQDCRNSCRWWMAAQSKVVVQINVASHFRYWGLSSRPAWPIIRALFLHIKELPLAMLFPRSRVIFIFI